jgi:hypothetical protein
MSLSRYRTARPKRTKRGPLDFSRHARSVAMDRPRMRAASCSVRACVSCCPCIGSLSRCTTDPSHAGPSRMSQSGLRRGSVKRRQPRVSRAERSDAPRHASSTATAKGERPPGDQHQRRLGAAEGRKGGSLPRRPEPARVLFAAPRFQPEPAPIRTRSDGVGPEVLAGGWATDRAIVPRAALAPDVTPAAHQIGCTRRAPRPRCPCALLSHIVISGLCTCWRSPTRRPPSRPARLPSRPSKAVASRGYFTLSSSLTRPVPRKRR